MFIWIGVFPKQVLVFSQSSNHILLFLQSYYICTKSTSLLIWRIRKARDFRCNRVFRPVQWSEQNSTRSNASRGQDFGTRSLMLMSLHPELAPAKLRIIRGCVTGGLEAVLPNYVPPSQLWRTSAPFPGESRNLRASRERLQCWFLPDAFSNEKCILAAEKIVGSKSFRKNEQNAEEQKTKKVFVLTCGWWCLRWRGEDQRSQETSMIQKRLEKMFVFFPTASVRVYRNSMQCIEA